MVIVVFFFFFIPYILVDASGWVVSDVSFGIMGGFRVFQHQTPSPKWPSWHRSNSNSHPGSQPAHPHKEKTKRKMTTEKALYIILQRPIRAKLYWWLLNLFFKNREATLLCFFLLQWGHYLVICSFRYVFLPFPPFF